MVRAWHFAIADARQACSNPAWYKFRDTCPVFPLSTL